MTVQTITTPSGERLVVLTEEEYEDLIDIRDHARAMDAYRRGEGEWLTDAEMDAYLASPSPLAYGRKRRGLTQAALAEAMGITQPYLAQIEGGRRTGAILIIISVSLSGRASPRARDPNSAACTPRAPVGPPCSPASGANLLARHRTATEANPQNVLNTHPETGVRHLRKNAVSYECPSLPPQAHNQHGPHNIPPASDTLHVPRPLECLQRVHCRPRSAGCALLIFNTSQRRNYSHLELR